MPARCFVARPVSLPPADPALWLPETHLQLLFVERDERDALALPSLRRSELAHRLPRGDMARRVPAAALGPPRLAPARRRAACRLLGRLRVLVVRVDLGVVLFELGLEVGLGELAAVREREPFPPQNVLDRFKFALVKPAAIKLLG